jgi:hypothetical protein
MSAEKTCCKICKTDLATEKHHVQPKSKGGVHGEIIDCCCDCGGQVHMLFNNHVLASMDLDSLLETDEMKSYISWKKKHPGPHKHRMSAPVKQWKKGHR